VEHVIYARLCLCGVPEGRDPIEEGHEPEPHRGGRGAAEGGRARGPRQVFLNAGSRGISKGGIYYSIHAGARLLCTNMHIGWGLVEVILLFILGSNLYRAE
jgi:hypothetical protein